MRSVACGAVLLLCLWALPCWAEIACPAPLAAAELQPGEFVAVCAVTDPPYLWAPLRLGDAFRIVLVASPLVLARSVAGPDRGKIVVLPLQSGLVLMRVPDVYVSVLNSGTPP